jgi:hypothetical protein
VAVKQPRRPATSAGGGAGTRSPSGKAAGDAWAASSRRSGRCDRAVRLAAPCAPGSAPPPWSRDGLPRLRFEQSARKRAVRGRGRFGPTWGVPGLRWSHGKPSRWSRVEPVIATGTRREADTSRALAAGTTRAAGEKPARSRSLLPSPPKPTASRPTPSRNTCSTRPKPKGSPVGSWTPSRPSSGRRSAWILPGEGMPSRLGAAELTVCGLPRAVPPASGVPSRVGRFRCSRWVFRVRAVAR